MSTWVQKFSIKDKGRASSMSYSKITSIIWRKEDTVKSFCDTKRYNASKNEAGSESNKSHDSSIFRSIGLKPSSAIK